MGLLTLGVGEGVGVREGSRVGDFVGLFVGGGVFELTEYTDAGAAVAPGPMRTFMTLVGHA